MSCSEMQCMISPTQKFKRLFQLLTVCIIYCKIYNLLEKCFRVSRQTNMKYLCINNTSCYNNILNVFVFSQVFFLFVLGNYLRVHKVNNCHGILIFFLTESIIQCSRLFSWEEAHGNLQFLQDTYNLYYPKHLSWKTTTQWIKPYQIQTYETICLKPDVNSF